MHGMIYNIETRPAFDIDVFNAFIASLYDSGVIAPLHVLNDITCEQEYFRRTG